MDPISKKLENQIFRFKNYEKKAFMLTYSRNLLWKIFITCYEKFAKCAKITRPQIVECKLQNLELDEPFCDFYKDCKWSYLSFKFYTHMPVSILYMNVLFRTSNLLVTWKYDFSASSALARSWVHVYLGSQNPAQKPHVPYGQNGTSE